MPQESNFSSRILRSIVSIALDKSRNMVIGISPLSIVYVRLSTSSCAANSVECPFLKPY